MQICLNLFTVYGENLFKVFMMFYLNAVIFFKENKLGLESIAGMLILKTLGEGWGGYFLFILYWTVIETYMFYVHITL